VLPKSITEPLTQALRSGGDRSQIRATLPVPTDGVSKAVRLITATRSYFLKWNQTPYFGLFKAEAQGLRLISRTETIRVPAVFATHEATPSAPGFMLQEWIEPLSQQDNEGRLGATLGCRLASMHQVSATLHLSGYGWNPNGNIGQMGDWGCDWVGFFRDRLLRPQVKLAANSGLLFDRRLYGLEQVLEGLDTLLGGVTRQSSLLHGDFHALNVLCDDVAAPVLVDPSVLYGDREFEIAGAYLWGDFPSDFFDAYNETWPLSDGFAERCDLYKLFHYVRMLGWKNTKYYMAQVDRILERYVGPCAKTSFNLATV
jgi:fructosamine-3-kinase